MPENIVVNKGCYEVIGRCDGMHIAREMKIDLLHRQHLRIASSCRTALHAEARAERGFAQRNDGSLPRAVM